MFITVVYDAQNKRYISEIQSHYTLNKNSKKFELDKKTRNKCKLLLDNLSENTLKIQCNSDIATFHDIKSVNHLTIMNKRYVFSCKDLFGNSRLIIDEPGNMFKLSDEEHLIIYSITGLEQIQ